MYKALTLNTLNIKSVKTFLYKTAIKKMALKLHTNTQLAITSKGKGSATPVS